MKVAEGRQRQERVPETLAAFLIFLCCYVMSFVLPNLTDMPQILKYSYSSIIKNAKKTYFSQPIGGLECQVT